MNAKVLFHGFSVPLIGLSADATLQECEDCHDEHGLLETKLSFDGHFRCAECTARNDTFAKAES